jgi:hypothetical protein
MAGRRHLIAEVQRLRRERKAPPRVSVAAVCARYDAMFDATIERERAAQEAAREARQARFDEFRQMREARIRARCDELEAILNRGFATIIDIVCAHSPERQAALERARVALAESRALAELLPGERPPAPPKPMVQ